MAVLSGGAPPARLRTIGRRGRQDTSSAVGWEERASLSRPSCSAGALQAASAEGSPLHFTAPPADTPIIQAHANYGIDAPYWLRNLIIGGVVCFLLSQAFLPLRWSIQPAI